DALHACRAVTRDLRNLRAAFDALPPATIWLRDPEPLFRHLPLQSVSELEALASEANQHAENTLPHRTRAAAHFPQEWLGLGRQGRQVRSAGNAAGGIGKGPANRVNVSGNAWPQADRFISTDVLTGPQDTGRRRAGDLLNLAN